MAGEVALARVQLALGEVGIEVRIQLREYVEQTGDILGAAAMNDIEVFRDHRHASQNRRSPTEDDTLDIPRILESISESKSRTMGSSADVVTMSPPVVRPAMRPAAHRVALAAPMPRVA